MKRSELFFSVVLIPLDYVMIALAGLAAYGLRFGGFVTDILPVVFEMPLRDYMQIVFVVAGIWVVVFGFAGLYSLRSTRKFIDEMIKISIASSAAIMLLIIIIFFQRELFSSRFIVLLGWVLAVIFVIVGRTIVRMIQRSLLKRGIGAHRVVMVGNGKTTEEIVAHLERDKTLGYVIVEQMKVVDGATFDRLKTLHDRHLFDEIIQADPAMSKEETMKLIDFSNQYHVGFRYAADLYNTKVTNIAVSTIAGVPVIELKKTPLDGWGRVAKRAMDLTVAALGLVLLSPFFLLIALFIQLDSRGPVFVRLPRVGEGGREFEFYKFRSMVAGAHTMKKKLLRYNERNDGPLFKMTNDPRVTRLGRVLRRSSIDELPQLINVLFGRMSLVGPRPHEPEEVKQYEAHERKLLGIKPGMTGMSQVSGRSELSFADEVRLDNYYIENWSPRLDLLILLRTLLVVIRGRASV